MQQKQTSQQLMHREKTIVALSSVGAAIGLTVFKLVVGSFTGSLGILAEAAHSGLDLVAALMTLFAVRIASRPADANHNYGHGKVENLSAFLEAVLLIATGVWIIIEAIRRLLYHEGSMEISIWAFIVMFSSIIIDITRSRALLRVARKHGSQALEADALHFSTDIWSSAVVIVGLVIVYLTELLHLPGWLAQSDAVAALGVSVIVIWVSARLIRDTLDALLDKAPHDLGTHVRERLRTLPDVLEVRRMRVRRAGNKHFIDIVIAAPRTFTFDQTHRLSERIEEQTVEAARPDSPQGEFDVVVHVEPTASPRETVSDQIRYLAEAQGIHAHDIHVREVDGALEVDLDVEVRTDMTLQEAHAQASRFEHIALQQNPHLRRVTTHIEAPSDVIVARQEVTNENTALREEIRRIANGIAGEGRAHEVHVYRRCDAQSDHEVFGSTATETATLDVTLHITFDALAPLSQVHIWAEEIKRALRRAHPYLDTVTIHTEPPETA
ncbi:cation diffusion facilitator family transporter [Ktedonospora formicarum]|uniref:Cation transporter n=1 Tax=Ktedonospora formicarum TaxID=2778364 RepID=A0A8J3HX05_9CHLR|nr:cation diffusion facilitator family transporter [Ktedonospora formicarum]GHO44796.1 cation transporter [Ktedonospora formicarum]